MTAEEQSREERYLQKGLKELERVSLGLQYDILELCSNLEHGTRFSIIPYGEKELSQERKRENTERRDSLTVDIGSRQNRPGGMH